MDLLELNRSTGEATFLATVTSSAGTVYHGEGLTARNGELYISFTLTDNDTWSRRIGELSLGGVISNDIDRDYDMDGLATDASGQIYAIDTDPPVDLNRLRKVLPDNSYLGDHPRDGRQANDIDFWGGSLYAPAAESVLFRIDPTDGSLLGTVSLSEGGLYGIALVPEPTTALLVAFGLAGLAAAGRRRSPR